MCTCVCVCELTECRLESRFCIGASVGFMGGVDWEGWGWRGETAAGVVGGYVGVCEEEGYGA